MRYKWGAHRRFYYAVGGIVRQIWEEALKRPLFFCPIPAVIVKNISPIIPYNYYLVYLQ